MEDLECWGLPTIQRDIAPFRWHVPRITSVEGYGYVPGDQRYLVEVWVEKSTVDDVLQPICDRWAANLVSSVGFQSITSVITLLKRITELQKPTRIFYISDFDPAGDRMPVSVARQLEYWLDQFAKGADIKLIVRQLEDTMLPPLWQWFLLPIGIAGAITGWFLGR
jgi:hypothetical protein